MEAILFLFSWLAVFLSPALAPAALRCGLCACLRFSPRAALALASLSSCFSCAGQLLCRGFLRAVPCAQRTFSALAAVLGGTAGRMAVLMFTARFSGSLSLARLQSLPLVVLSAAALLPPRLRLPRSRAGLFFFSLACAWADGFFGCGGILLFMRLNAGGVRRKAGSPPGAALLLGMLSQLCALLLTLLSGAAQVFPVRTLLAVSLGATLGAVCFEKQKKRAAAAKGLRIALVVYVLLAALAGAEQAFFLH